MVRPRIPNSRPTSPLVRATPSLIVGLGCVALSILVSTDAWIAWFAHPVRIDRLGSVPPETIRGAELLGITSLVAGIFWLTLPLVERLLRGGLPDPARQQRPTFDGRTALGLLVITGLAALPRILRVGESLWFDEIAALLSSSAHGVGPALGNYHTLANHLLHSATVAWIVQGGADEISIRMPALVAGLACVPAMYMLGRSADDEKLGWIAAAVFAVMPITVLESVESRGYSFMILFAILSTHQWLRIRSGSAWSIGSYALFATLGCWSHLVFVVVPIGHTLASVISAMRDPRERPALRRTLVADAVAAATTIMVLSPVLPDLLRRRSEFVALDGDEPSWFGPEGWHAFLGLGGSWTWWAALPGLALMAVGVSELLRWPRLRTAVVAGILGGMTLLLITLGAQSWIYARFAVFMTVPVALLIAAGIRSIADFDRRGIVGPTTFIGLAVLWSVSVLSLPPKQPIRDAVADLQSLTGSDAEAWSIGLPEDVAGFYTTGRGPRLVRTGLLGSELDARDLQVGPDHVLMLYPRRVSVDLRTQLREAGFTIHRVHEGWLDWGHGDVEVWSRTPRE